MPAANAPAAVHRLTGNSDTTRLILDTLDYDETLALIGQQLNADVVPQELAQQIMSGAPPDPDLPKPLVKVLRRCLARSPFERYPDARTLGESLQKAVTEEGIVGDSRELGATSQSQYQGLLDTPPEQRALPMSAPPPAAGSSSSASAPGRVVRGPKPADLKRTMMAVAPPPPKPGAAPSASELELGRPGGTGATGDSVAVQLPSDGRGPEVSFGPAGSVGHDDETTIGSRDATNTADSQATFENPLGKPHVIEEGNTTEELEVAEVEEIEDDDGTATRTRRMDTEDIDTRLMQDTDLVVTCTGNSNVCDDAMLRSLKSGTLVCNIGHFDNEIDTAYMRENWEWEEVKPQVHKIYRNKEDNDHLLLLSEGRLVNLGNATGHPSRIMDGSFANQVLAQIYLFERKFADNPDDSVTLEVLPKKLDEEVAAHMVAGFGGVITKLTQEQADYINVSVDGPYKVESYKY